MVSVVGYEGFSVGFTENAPTIAAPRRGCEYEVATPDPLLSAAIGTDAHGGLAGFLVTPSHRRQANHHVGRDEGYRGWAQKPPGGMCSGFPRPKRGQAAKSVWLA